MKLRQFLLLPTGDQWRGWSLPSRLGFVGTYVGIISLFLSVAFFLWPTTTPPTIKDLPFAESPEFLQQDTARDLISQMVRELEGMSSMKILNVTNPVKGMVAVAIHPPYREFPNVILFRFDEVKGRWQRVFEGLTLGLTPKGSEILDIHTVGYGVDIKAVDSGRAMDVVTDTALSRGFMVVEYEKFFHLHPVGPEGYFLDKKSHTRLIKRLFPRKKDSIYDLQCALYNVPDIVSLSLSYEGTRFVLKAVTDNNQAWSVGFAGVDASGRLDRKVIDATSLGVFPWDEEEHEMLRPEDKF